MLLLISAGSSSVLVSAFDWQQLAGRAAVGDNRRSKQTFTVAYKPWTDGSWFGVLLTTGSHWCLQVNEDICCLQPISNKPWVHKLTAALRCFGRSTGQFVSSFSQVGYEAESGCRVTVCYCGAGGRMALLRFCPLCNIWWPVWGQTSSYVDREMMDAGRNSVLIRIMNEYKKKGYH